MTKNNPAKFYSTKTYGTDRGLSCCFRQWKATHSHCSLLHGYSIGIKLIFESNSLDSRNWVMDFGGLKTFQRWAEYMFDHTLLIADQDPHLETFQKLASIYDLNNEALKQVDEAGDLAQLKPHERRAICDLRIVPAVGCEMFAKMAYDKMSSLLTEMQDPAKTTARYPVNCDVRLKSVEVFEHGANSAIYEGSN